MSLNAPNWPRNALPELKPNATNCSCHSPRSLTEPSSPFNRTVPAMFRRHDKERRLRRAKRAAEDALHDTEEVQKAVDEVTARLEQHLQRDRFREAFEQALKARRPW